MGLEDLQSALSSYRTQLANKRAEQRGYYDKADEIRAVYNELAGRKSVLEGYRNTVSTFSESTYGDFVGNVFTTTYVPKVEELVSYYNTVIDNVDTNLDNLNNEVTRYENLGLQCDGPIGYLASVVNSLIGQIQNWVN
ncbi:MAG: DUF5082 family protein [Lachnospiraceae bacterium]|nr:DUF5082 family protein [Lachnospiraceae bacterium]